MRPVAGRHDPRAPRDDHLSNLMETVGADRDHAAFAELFHDLAPRVRRLLVHRGVSWPVAEELTQETMLAVWRLAAMFNRIEIVDVLLSRGADLAAQDAGGLTAEALAGAMGANDTAERLAEAARNP